MNTAIKGLLLAALSIWCIGCNKKVDPLPLLKNTGKTTAKLNGQSWESNLTACNRFPGTDFYEFSIYSPESPGYNYSLDFEFIPIRPQPITTKLHSILHMVQGHDNDMHRYESAYAMLDIIIGNGGVAQYLVDQASDIPNYVTVDAYDSTTGHVTGNFQVTLYKNSESRGTPEGRYMDTLRFTDGKFDLMIK